MGKRRTQTIGLETASERLRRLPLVTMEKE